MGRAIIGGLVGTVAGTVLWLSLESILGRNMVWLAPVVGLLAGLGVRVLAKERNSMTGVVAAAMALVGVVGGPLILPLVLDRMYDATAKPVPSVSNAPSLETESEFDDELENNEELADDTELDEPETVGSEPMDEPQTEPAERADEDESASLETDVISNRLSSAVRNAGPRLAQATGMNDGSGLIDLISYIASAILAYLLGTGSNSNRSSGEGAGNSDRPQ